MDEELRTYGEMLSRVPAGLYARLLTLGPTDDEFWRDDVLMILAEIEAAGKVIVDRERFERLRAYAVANHEFQQASTWAGIWSDDEVERKAVELQYAGREKRRREAFHAITVGDLEPLP